MTRFPLPNPGAFPYDITTGPDGNLWFTENTSNKIGRMTPTGTVTEFPIPTANSGPRSITTGPDGKIYFVEYTANKIGRLAP
jgi:virginiamycin B lyase